MNQLHSLISNRELTELMDYKHENEKMREILKFYADKNNYIKLPQISECSVSLVDKDCGELARKVLALNT